MTGTCGCMECLWSGDGHFCEMLCKAGVPLNGKWPVLVLCLRGVGADKILSEPQKAAIQELLVETLRQRDFSDENYEKVYSHIRDILAAPYEQKLEEITREASSLADEANRILGRHTQGVLTVAKDMDEGLAGGTDPATVLSDLRGALQCLAEKMEQDMHVLTDLSHKDSLTGLANRRSFDEFLGEAVHGWVSEKIPAALIMLDVDYFKSFNDTYGHLVGDQVLRTMASIVRRFSMPSSGDTLTLAARYGGEEFAVILRGSGALDAPQLAERIRHAMSEASLLLRDADGDIVATGIQVTASFGVASIWKGWKGAFAANLIDCADKALYYAKRSGRNCTVRYAPESRQGYELMRIENAGLPA